MSLASIDSDEVAQKWGVAFTAVLSGGSTDAFDALLQPDAVVLMHVSREDQIVGNQSFEDISLATGAAKGSPGTTTSEVMQSQLLARRTSEAYERTEVVSRGSRDKQILLELRRFNRSGVHYGTGFALLSMTSIEGEWKATEIWQWEAELTGAHGLDLRGFLRTPTPSSQTPPRPPSSLAQAAAQLEQEEDIAVLRSLALGLLEENLQLRSRAGTPHADHDPEHILREAEAEVDGLLSQLKESAERDPSGGRSEDLKGRIRSVRRGLERVQQLIEEQLIQCESQRMRLQAGRQRAVELVRCLPVPLQTPDVIEPVRRSSEPSQAAAQPNAAPRRLDRFGVDSARQTLKLTIDVTPATLATHGHEVALEVRRSDTTADVKQRLSDAGLRWGPPGLSHLESVSQARLLLRGMPLKTDVPLTALGVCDGSRLRLVPAMCKSSLRARDGYAGGAPRGLLMNTGTLPWEAARVRAGELAHCQDLANRGLSEHLPSLSDAKRGKIKPLYPST